MTNPIYDHRNRLPNEEFYEVAKQNKAVSIWDTLKDDPKVDGAFRRTAELAKDIREHDKYTHRLFERIRMNKQETEEAGAAVSPHLSPVQSAAYGEWLRGQDVPRRLELTELAEAPLPPEDDEQ